MNELVKFIAQYDSDFPNRIKGASEEKITKLEKLAGTLPTLFREVLISMGEDHSNFTYAWNSYITIEELIDEYESNLELVNDGEGSIIPQNSVLIGWGNELLSESVVVKRDEEKFAKVFVGEFDEELLRDDDQEIRIIADSLYNFFFGAAFEIFTLQSFKKRKWFYKPIDQSANSNTKIEETLKFAKKWNFEKQIYSDTKNFCGLRKDSAIFIPLTSKENVNIMIGTQTQELIDIFANELEQLGFEEQEWS
jgi:hypothetical protein